MFSQKFIVRTSTMRMTWFIRRLPSITFSGVNSNTRHWSASENSLKFIKDIRKRKTLVKHMTIRDVKTMITIKMAIMIMVMSSNEVKHLLIVSPLEYIYFNSSIHFLPFFSSILVSRLIPF